MTSMQHPGYHDDILSRSDYNDNTAARMTIIFMIIVVETHPARSHVMCCFMRPGSLRCGATKVLMERSPVVMR